ncbi:hypothetical protein EJP82_26710 [Paenibacillus anaericanus]|uniref:Uncharacterized protein n=1 Tax=Paenibacillus anaericanus TaxID=170367 RepID=A0A433XVW9_9BACL|nr:hypothetical protein [Paenibacillus anaericanus]RUT38707.1 hypothetical protein EJP82_26710 [Paenibacillus anaericanus]
MNTWKTNLVTIEEVAFDYDLHAFEVYNHAGAKLGTINPATVEEMNFLIADLDKGSCPVSEKWEDGNGNTCNANGWGEHSGN